METHADIKTKTVIITGATSGIGFAATRKLTAMGAKVLAVGRSPERCNQARDIIIKETPDANIEFLLADLSSQQQIKQLVDDIKSYVHQENNGKIDVLVNNAGAVANWYMATEDGFELQFAVNHLAPFMLTHLLLALLRKSTDARVLTVSSNSHRNMRIHWRDVMFRRGYNTLLAYKQSKLANVMFTYELNRRLGIDSTVKAYAIDPGLVNTEIGLKGTKGIVRWVWDQRRKKGMSPQESAERIVYVASQPDVNISKSAYWKDFKPLIPSQYAMREDEAERLWDLSERLCGFQ